MAYHTSEAFLLTKYQSDCALIVTRYVNQLRYEKRDVRRSRMMQRQSAYDAFHRRFSSVASEGGVEGDKEGQGLLHQEINPYDAYERTQSRSPAVTPTVKSARDYEQTAEVFGDNGRSTEVRAGEDIEMGHVGDRESLSPTLVNSNSHLETPHTHERPISEDYTQPALRPRSPPPGYF